MSYEWRHTKMDLEIFAIVISKEGLIICRLKSVGAIKMKFVAPMPEQIATTTIQFLKI